MVHPPFSLLCSLILTDLNFICYAAAGVVSNGGSKKSPRTSSIVQVIFLIDMFTALKGYQFYFYLLLLQLILCRVVALKVSMLYIINSAGCIFLLVLWDQRG